ncbi:hypothetical protein B6S12_03970 [Helicobacter valdiviensis]|uniref:Uncharacterized protein n=1 Tax=Helicobacter valdiviensis TaxID=1458358 RepID=A0A2W6MVD9_9HELI|nr:hypothetical protein [Helicobacter valdiviensis]PZT48494.1 hypothetical protein B6S12_03970 [Helicobacter valdiviensis]
MCFLKNPKSFKCYHKCEFILRRDYEFWIIHNYFQSGVNNAIKSTTSPLSWSNFGIIDDTLTKSSQLANNGFNFGDFLGSSAFSNSLSAFGAASSILGGISGYKNAKKALGEQKRMNDLLENQYNIENKRYNELKSERDAATKEIRDAAKLYKLPTERE